MNVQYNVMRGYSIRSEAYQKSRTRDYMDNANTDLFADRDYWKYRAEQLELENRNAANQFISEFTYKLKNCDETYRTELRRVLGIT